LIPDIVVANGSLDLNDTPAAATTEERTEADWRQEASEEAWAFKEAFVRWVTENLGQVRIDYKPKSYVGVRVGRRTWAPLWLRQDGATVYLPDPDGSRSDDPSLAFENFEPRLRDEGVTASWVPNTTQRRTPFRYDCDTQISSAPSSMSCCLSAMRSSGTAHNHGPSE
jgi:hypothetical protein